MPHRDAKIADLTTLILTQTLVELTMLEIAQSIAPTRIERALRYVQCDPTALRAIRKTVVLPGNVGKQRERMAEVDAAVMYYMGVTPRWKHLDDDYFDVESDEAAPDALVRKDPGVLTSQKPMRPKT